MTVVWWKICYLTSLLFKMKSLFSGNEHYHLVLTEVQSGSAIWTQARCLLSGVWEAKLGDEMQIWTGDIRKLFTWVRKQKRYITENIWLLFNLCFIIFHSDINIVMSGVRALYIVRCNIKWGLPLLARGNVIQKQFGGNCKVTWHRVPEAIETLNIISGQYKSCCKTTCKNMKTFLSWPQRIRNL